MNFNDIINIVNKGISKTLGCDIRENWLMERATAKGYVMPINLTSTTL